MLPRLRCQTEASMSRPSQTESTYVQTVPDESCLCPDFRALARLSRVHVQTFLRSCPDFRVFRSRLSCVHQTFVRSTDFCSFMSRLWCVHQIFVRSIDFSSFMSRFSCVHQTFVRSTDYCSFMSRLWCVHQIFVLSCSDFRAFFDVSRLCNFERTTPPSCVHLRSGHTCFRLGSQPGLLSEKQNTHKQT